MSPAQPPSIWDSLTPEHQGEIVDHVEGCYTVLADRPLEGATVEDFARWAIDGLGHSAPIADAFEQGVELGRQQMHDEIAALADE